MLKTSTDAYNHHFVTSVFSLTVYVTVKNNSLCGFYIWKRSFVLLWHVLYVTWENHLNCCFVGKIVVNLWHRTVCQKVSRNMLMLMFAGT